MIKLVFDNLIFSWQKAGGISLYWGKLLERLDISRYRVKCVEYSQGDRNLVRREMSFDKDIDCNTLPTKCFALERYVDLRLAQEKGPFIFHSSYYRCCSNPNAINVVTVHDFIYEYYLGGLAKQIHCWAKRRTINKADLVVCVSESTRKDLYKFVPNVDRTKVKVIHNGVSEVFQPIPGKVKGDYLLFVGSRAEYKNFIFAVEVAAALKKQLIIVGGPLKENEIDFLKTKLVENYETRSFIPDHELNELYNGALALLYPSSYEGFGIPVVEAQRAGCPVVALGVSSIPEVIGDYPLLVDSLDKKKVVSLVRKLSSDSEFLEEVRQKGYANADRFSWKKMALAYNQCYDELWSEKIEKNESINYNSNI